MRQFPPAILIRTDKKQNIEEVPMKFAKMIPLALCAAVFCAVLAPRAKADEWNKKTIVTFNVPVQIPGETLQPGTYVFVRMNPIFENTMQVWNKNQNHLIATIHTIPDYHFQPYDQATFHLYKNHKLIRKATPPSTLRLHSWFYPGDQYGRSFTYPHYPTAEASNSYSGSMKNAG
jgi:hypothetical protein